MSHHSVHGRRLTLLVAAVLAFVMAPSSAAFAAPQYSLFTSADTTSSGTSGETYAQIEGTVTEVPGPMRLVVKRGGAVVLDETGDYAPSGGDAFTSVDSNFVPQVGDVFELYNPGTAPAPARTLQFTGRPSLESCPVGQRTLTGKVDAGTTLARVFAFRPSAGKYDPARINPATVSQSGDTYAATFRDTLQAGDIVFVSSTRQVDPEFTYRRQASTPAGTCVPEGGGGGGGGGGGTGGGTGGGGGAQPPNPGRCTNERVGTSASETLLGTAFGDLITGMGGNDLIDGLAGDDCINGLAGNDTLRGSAGADAVEGGAGNDRISGGSGPGTLRGGAGTDRVTGGSAGDVIAGNVGDDRLSGAGGRDRISGGPGRDRITGGGGRDSIEAGSGDDRISAKDGVRDSIDCGRGRDTVVSRDRKDKLTGCERR